MSSFKKRTSQFLTIFLTALVVIGFTFTGFQSFRGSPDTIAKYGDIPIKFNEFQQEYKRQQNFYKQIFGGKELTKEQIKNFQIKQAAIKNIAMKKITLKMSKDFNIGFSANEIKKEIKSLPYFKTNNQFDINKYKLLLKSNGYSPNSFENNIKDDLLLKKYQKITSQFHLSKNLNSKITELKNNNKIITLVKIDKETLRLKLKVTKSEIQKYLKDHKNYNRVLSIFNERKKTLNKPARVKARHILVKNDTKNPEKALKKINKIKKLLTLKNFKKLANKYTEDPSGKKSGGNLGWFSKEKMVPEFAKVAFSLKVNTISEPVKTQFGYHIILVEAHKEASTATIEEYKNKFAIELIRKNKNKELDKLYKKTISIFEKTLKLKNISKVEQLNKHYNFTISKQVKINLFDATGDSKISLTNDQVFKLIHSSNTYQTFSTDNNSTILVLKYQKNIKKTQDKINNNSNTKSIKKIEMFFTRQLNQNLISDILKSKTLEIYNNFKI